VVAELNAARDNEYAEVLDRLPELRRELATEQARGNVTYAEVEESEADLERFRTWLSKIAARDHFIAPHRTPPPNTLMRCCDHRSRWRWPGSKESSGAESIVELRAQDGRLALLNLSSDGRQCQVVNRRPVGAARTPATTSGNSAAVN